MNKELNIRPPTDCSVKLIKLISKSQHIFLKHFKTVSVTFSFNSFHQRVEISFN